jgi:hypothetical protein
MQLSACLTRRLPPFRHLILTSCFTITVLLLSPVLSRAREEPPVEETPSELTEQASLIDKTQKRISRRIAKMADQLDSFFGDERIEEESNKTDLTLKFSIQAEQGGALDFGTRAKLNLVLPRLEDRLHFVISREQGGSQDLDDLLDGEEPPIIDGAETVDWSSALRLILKSTRDMNIHADAGVKMRLPPQVFTRLRYRQTFHLPVWAIRFTQKVGVFQDSGWEESTRLDFDRRLSSTLLFRTSTTGSWFEEKPGYFVHQGFSFFQRLNRYRSLLYEWNTSSRTGKSDDKESAAGEEPEARFRIDETYVGFRYRQALFWKWLLGELSPGVAFPRNQDYKATARVIFRIEIQFRDTF